MSKFIKRCLVSGILVIVPVVATLWILKTLIMWLDGIIFSFLPYQLLPENLLGYSLPGVGLVLTFIIIVVVGFFARLYIGKRFVKVGDAIFARVPFARTIYKATQNVLETTLSEGGDKRIKRAVLVEYPKAGSYAVGFLTGTWDKPLLKEDGKKCVTVFVPTTPNPTSGFLLIVPEDAVYPTGMSAEEASKLIISGGLLAKKVEEKK